MRIHLFQIDTSDSEGEVERSNRVLNHLSQVDRNDLVVLPEQWLVGAFSENVDQILATQVYETFCSKAIQIARERQFRIVLGSGFELDRTGSFFNRSDFFDFENENHVVYRKVHRFANELDVISPGNKVTSFQIENSTASLMICYDLRFPEMFRQKENYGSELFIIVSAWPLSRIGIWLNLVVSRAIENQAFVVGVNSVGSQGGIILGGNSVVVAPSGDILTHLGTSQTFRTCDLDFSTVRGHRASFPYLADARLINGRDFCQ